MQEKSLKNISIFIFAGISFGLLLYSALNLQIHSKKKTRRRNATATATATSPGTNTASLGLLQRPGRPRTAGPTERTPYTEPTSNESDLQVWAIDESENLLNLIMTLAEEQTLADTIIHRSVTCNHCGMSPVRGWRFKCANCLDFDLCGGCESLDIHYKTHSFLKIKIPIPPQSNPRSIIFAPFYPGIPWIHTPSFDTSTLEAETHFDGTEIMGFYEQFKSLSTVDGHDGGITKATFERLCVGSLKKESQLIVDRIFFFFDRNGDGVISFEAMVRGLSVLCKGSMQERIKYAFEGYDLDGDGFISRDELRKMFKSYFFLSMELVRGVVKVMEEGMMESFDDEAEKPVSAAFGAPATMTNNEGMAVFNIPDRSQQHHDTAATRQSKDEPLTHLINTHLQPQEEGEISDRLKPHLLTTNNDPRRGSLDTTSPISRYDEDLPLMESISHDAIEEMVAAVFEIGGNEEGLGFSQFEVVVRHDPNVLAWIESLGSVF